MCPRYCAQEVEQFYYSCLVILKPSRFPMAALGLGNICGPDMVTWFWFQFLLVPPPMTAVALGSISAKCLRWARVPRE